MIQQADTVGVFQIESRAQMSMLPRLKPANFYDLVVEIALVRPGPIQGKMVHPYLRRRQGLEPVTYPHPALESVLGRTFGVPLFQEQVMELAMVAGGFSGGEADHLRRAMGTWRNHGRLEGILDKLVRRMENNGISPEYARRIADQIGGFGEYGFPESHAASFALLAYASAYLKCHYPALFAAALLNSQPMGFYSPASIVEDCRRHGVPVGAICVNRSHWESTLEDLPEQEAAGGFRLRLGMCLVRGLRTEMADRLLAARHNSGHFSDLKELIRRTNLPGHVLLKLALAGAFSSFGLDRRNALWKVLETWREPESLFFGMNQAGPTRTRQPMNDRERVLADLDATSVFLSMHPFQLVYPRLKRRRGFYTSSQLAKLPDGKKVMVAGLAVIKQRPPTAGGVLFMTLEDHQGFLNLVVPPAVMQRYRRPLLEEALLLVHGRLDKADGVTNISVRQVKGIHMEFERRRVQAREFR